MMDTILNVGINDALEAALAQASGNGHHAARVRHLFEAQFREVVLKARAEPIPADPWVQLRLAVCAVFDSWHSQRAQVYRHNRGLSDDGCTAVTIQAMVFGNLDARSGTGVLFSRNPITGESLPWGEWLAQGQGEEVVSGRRTPAPLSALRAELPEVHTQLVRAAKLLEADARDIQDMEFTVESGRLWLLQTRMAKRSPQAALRVAVNFADEGLISQAEALDRLNVEQARSLRVRRLMPRAAQEPLLASGEPACPGVASGWVVTDSESAQLRARQGEDVILARATTSPQDLHGMIAARGVMTEQGGSTSHAAVLSRELGRPCVVGCGLDAVTTLAGQMVTLDGASGRVWSGNWVLDDLREDDSNDVRKLLNWGAPRIPLRLLSMEQAPVDAVDLDAHGNAWRSALQPGATVRGEILESEQGLRAALAAGVSAVVVRNRLAALIVCLRFGSATAADSEAAASHAIAVSELMLLRLIGLKGVVSHEVLESALSLTNARQFSRPLCQQGLCTPSARGVRLTSQGRERLATLLSEERARLDPVAVMALYQEFRPFDLELKQIMTAWQLMPDGTPNDHGEAEYDATVLRRLADLHARVGALLSRLRQLAPRLSIYEARLGRAAARVAAGDRDHVARVFLDSYHSVWFELHEELIALAGLTRAEVERNDQASKAPRA